MIIKSTNATKTSLSYFDLLGHDEVALSKAFAYMLGYDIDCYYEFLKFIGIKQKRSLIGFQRVNIKTETKREEGRTDIEFLSQEKYHVIIECKINSNKISKQRTQYLTAFDSSVKQKTLCFLTQERDTNKQITDDIFIINTSWLEVIELYSNKKFINKSIVKDFLNFATRNYKMKQLKEVLIQDLKQPEIDRFEKYGVYRRNETFGTPIYFAPYYIGGNKKPVGISYLSKILGILTLKPSDIDSLIPDLESFKENNQQVENWIKGVKFGSDNVESIYTYYFLDYPLIFKKPLKKDGGIKKGRGKNWIAAHIPPNRCVSIIEFIKHIPELME